MRLGSPIFEKYDTAEEWVAILRRAGFRAAYCPVESGASPDRVREFANAAARAEIVIAEVGAWSNPLSPDDAIRKPALEKCQKALALAEEIGARCCVNIAGSRGAKWDGPCSEDLTPATFDLIVASVREIVDAVRPTRTFYTLEPMPWMFPDSAESYLELLRAVDRPGLGVHFDPVNLINSPERYFRNGAFVRDFVAKLGPRIRSVHAKDILLQDRLTVHLDEVRPGLGQLDYPAFLGAVESLGGDVPVLLEHLPKAEDYVAAAEYVRGVAREAGIGM
jgi:sugar phosphate isomerase/epimerase